MCARPITLDELLKALKQMKKGKSPGDDGLSVEFYCSFWDSIGPVFLEMVNSSYSSKSMPESTTRGVLKLIPKSGKDSRYLKNLRPITLLNVDYKLIEKVLALRMDRTLDTIINRDQNGFMANRKNFNQY